MINLKVIRALLDEKNLKIQDIAEKIGMTPQGLNKMLLIFPNAFNISSFGFIIFYFLFLQISF